MSSGKSMSKLFHEELYKFWRDYASIDENDPYNSHERPIYYLLENEIGDLNPFDCQLHVESIFADIFRVFYGEVVDLYNDPPERDPPSQFLPVQKAQILKFMSQLRNLKAQYNANFSEVSHLTEFLRILFTKFDRHLTAISLMLTNMSEDPTFTHEISKEAMMNNLLMRLQNVANDQ